MTTNYPDGFAITKTYNVKASEHSSDVRKITRTFDFSNADMTKVAEEALRSIVIKAQSTARRALANGDEPDTSDVNVSETFRSGRIVRKITKESAIEFLQNNMTREELVAALADTDE